MTTNRVDASPVAVTMPAMTLASPQGAQAPAGKPACVSDTQSDGNCFSVKPRKPRMVRVATDRPALAGVALGRTAPHPGSNQYRASRGARGRRPSQGERCRGRDREHDRVAEKHVATPKKAKKTASRRAPRRDPYWYGAPSWREVEYQRGGRNAPTRLTLYSRYGAVFE